MQREHRVRCTRQRDDFRETPSLCDDCMGICAVAALQAKGAAKGGSKGRKGKNKKAKAKVPDEADDENWATPDATGSVPADFAASAQVTFATASAMGSAARRVRLQQVPGRCAMGRLGRTSGMQLSDDSARLDTEADVALPNAKLLNGDAELTRFFGCEDARMTMTICTAFRACTPRTARRRLYAVTDRPAWNGRGRSFGSGGADSVPPAVCSAGLVRAAAGARSTQHGNRQRNGTARRRITRTPSVLIGKWSAHAGHCGQRTHAQRRAARRLEAACTRWMTP